LIPIARDEYKTLRRFPWLLTFQRHCYRRVNRCLVQQGLWSIRRPTERFETRVFLTDDDHGLPQPFDSTRFPCDANLQPISRRKDAEQLELLAMTAGENIGVWDVETRR